MSKRNLVLLVAALFMVFAMTVPALAENRVEVKVTSEPLPYKATCTKAGGFSLEFDSDTVLRAADPMTTTTDPDGYDVITIDLDYKDSSRYVALCRPIDFVIAPGASAPTVVASRYDDVSDIVSDTEVADTKNWPVYWRHDSQAGSVMDSVISNSVYFHIKGNVNTQRITFYVYGSNDGTIKVGGDSNDVLVVHFLDQTCEDTTTAAEEEHHLWWDETGNGIYDNSIECDSLIDSYQGNTIDGNRSLIVRSVQEKIENTLCVNVSLWDEATTDGNMDSRNDKYTFIPSDPQIGHIAEETGISFTHCKSERCGNIELGAEQGDVCAFDPEGSGYCSGSGSRYTYLMIKSLQPLSSFSGDDEISLVLYLRLMVNDSTGDQGVYFPNQSSAAYFISSGTDFCAARTNTMAGSSAAPSAEDNLTFASADDCTESGKTTYVSYNYGTVTANALTTHYGIWFNMPQIYYNTSMLQDGDVVSVQATLQIQFEDNVCGGQTITDEYCLGTFVEHCGAVTTLAYPYFTDYQDQTGYWNGIAITNMSSAAGTATLTIFESDGDVLRYTAAIGAREVWADILYNMIGDMTFVTEVDGTIGNTRCWISVSTDFSAGGFAMISDWNNNGASMGYLPK